MAFDLIDGLYPASTSAQALAEQEDALLIDLDIIGKLMEAKPDRVATACHLGRRHLVKVEVAPGSDGTLYAIVTPIPQTRKAA